MAVTQKEFDQATQRFTEACMHAANWKDRFGAAYSTRIRSAISDLLREISEMERVLDLDRR